MTTESFLSELKTKVSNGEYTAEVALSRLYEAFRVEISRIETALGVGSAGAASVDASVEPIPTATPGVEPAAIVAAGWDTAQAYAETAFDAAGPETASADHVPNPVPDHGETDTQTEP